MSSSEHCHRPTLIDLQTEVPATCTEDFLEQAEFPHIDSARTQEPTSEEAYRNGLVEGEQRGRAAALKELQPVVDEIKAMTVAMVNVREQRLQEAEADLVGVATELARRILHGELSQSEDVALRMARACIEEAKDEGDPVLHVAPADLELIRTHIAELQLDLADTSVQVQADPALAAGTVVLQTARRCYDGRPERILDHAAQALTDEETG